MMFFTWYGLVFITVLFVLLSPGMLLQIPGDNQPVDFQNWRTSLPSVVVHAVVFLALILLSNWLFPSFLHG
ncbi:unnamed protein product [Closterium sp. Naga37s-1]|nr:unnamed protein product [Closterium sp. Naga37s-1]